MEPKRPMETMRKKILRGRGLWALGLGVAGAEGVGAATDWIAGAGAEDFSAGLPVSFSVGFSVGFSGAGAFLVTTGVCFLWIWARVTAQAGGL